MSAVPAASTATIAGPLLPSLGALATIVMNQADTDGKLIESTNTAKSLPSSSSCSTTSSTSTNNGIAGTSSSSSNSNKGTLTKKVTTATNRGAGVAFSAFANSVFGRGRRRAF